MKNTNTHIITEETGKLFDALAKNILSLATGKKQFSIALSGGSTPNAFYKYLAELKEFSVLKDHIHFFWGDERCVPPDSDQSNYNHASSLLLQKTAISQEHIHRMHGENEPENEIERYKKILQQTLPEKDRLPVFDFIMLGLGTDGHTASIFPNTKPIISNNICAIYQHPETGQKRISLTEKTINNAKNIAFLVTGKNKKNIIKKIITQKPNKALPANRIDPVHGKLYWYIDKQTI